MYGRILKTLNIVNLYRGMFKLKINVKVPQLLCIVVSVALNGEFEGFGGFSSLIDYFNYFIDLFSSELLAILLSTNSK